MSYCLINGRTVPAAKAVISVQDRGFRYGDGVFETIAVHGGVPYQFDWHMTRLAEGLRSIKIPFVVDSLRGHCRQLLRKNKLDAGVLRIQVTRGIGNRGYLPGKAGAMFVIETMPMPPVPQAPVTLLQSSYSRVSARALPVRYKLSQGLNSTLARLEAAENECFDALLLNEHGQVCETSSANIFWFRKDTLYTPSLSCGVLEGATRSAVMRLSPYPLKEVTAAGIETLMQAEAVFITNTVWKTIAVNRLLPSKCHWNSEEITIQFHRLLTQDRKNYSQLHHKEWPAIQKNMAKRRKLG